MTAEPASPCERTAQLLHRVSRALRDPQDEAWLTVDLSLAQLKLLFSLFYRGPETVGALAGRLGVKLPTVSTTLERLVRAGYVERADDPQDRRVVINRLTPQGSALVERLREERRARVDQALARLAPEEVAVLQEGLSALARALGLQRPAGTNETAAGAGQAAAADQAGAGEGPGDGRADRPPERGGREADRVADAAGAPVSSSPRPTVEPPARRPVGSAAR